MTSETTENPAQQTLAATAKGDEALAAANPEPASQSGLMTRLLAVVNRYGYPVALAVAVLAFLFWPRNYGPRRQWDAGSDDLILLVLVAYLARQVAKRSPVLLNLPGAIARAVKRRLGLNG